VASIIPADRAAKLRGDWQDASQLLGWMPSKLDNLAPLKRTEAARRDDRSRRNLRKSAWRR